MNSFSYVVAFWCICCLLLRGPVPLVGLHGEDRLVERLHEGRDPGQLLILCVLSLLLLLLLVVSLSLLSLWLIVSS